LTVYGQWVSVSIPWLAMYTPMVVYHAPQMKNCRNIIALRRTVATDRIVVGAGTGRGRAPKAPAGGAAGAASSG
jgi:hypothetical protein